MTTETREVIQCGKKIYYTKPCIADMKSFKDYL
jgi:hypothetical protein